MRPLGNKTVQNHCLSLFEFLTVYAGAYWHKIYGICACAFAEQVKSSNFFVLSSLIFVVNFFFVFVCFASLIESEDLRQEKRHIKQLSCKGARSNKRHHDDPFVTD